MITPRCMQGRSRRAVALLAVLVVVTIGALTAATMLLRAGGEAAVERGCETALQSRSLAWSGVQAVMAQLSSQRERILAGGSPEIGDGATVFSGRGGAELGVFRVLPVDEQLAAPEMARLDVNTAPATMLALLPGMDESTAAAVAAGQSTGYSSVSDLVSIPGLSAELLFGREAEGVAAVEGGVRLPEDSGILRIGRLADLLTVFSFDPNVQCGAAARAKGVFGQRRIDIGGGWSEELGAAIEHRFDHDSAQVCKALMDRGEKFVSDADLVRLLRTSQVPVDRWPELLDAYSASSDSYLRGKVDLGSATAEVLACVPGIQASAAAQIVAARTQLDEERRSTVCWPVLEGILEPEQFEKAVDSLTTRCMQWRIVVEGGIELVGEDGSDGSRRPLRHAVRLEAVIDVAAMRPRVAYLRDITLLPLARQVVGDIAAEQSGEADDSPVAGAPMETEVNEIDPGLDLATELEFSMPETFVEPRVPATTEAMESSARSVPENRPVAGMRRPGKDERLGRWNTRGQP